MIDIKEVSNEDLNRPGPHSLTDERAAEELGLDTDELIRIMDVWMKHASEIAYERQRRRSNGPLASKTRTVVR